MDTVAASMSSSTYMNVLLDSSISFSPICTCHFDRPGMPSVHQGEAAHFGNFKFYHKL